MPTMSFPDDNITGRYNQRGQFVSQMLQKAELERPLVEPSQVFIGANPVKIGTNDDMVYVAAIYGEVVGKLTIGYRTLGLIGVPSRSHPLQWNVDRRYIDASDILLLLHHSVETGRSLALRPFLFDGSFASSNPELRVGDWILHAVYADPEGGVATWLEARVLPAAVV